MKRFLVICAVCLFCLSLPICGAEYEYTYGDEPSIYPSAEMDELFSSLPDAAREKLSPIIEAEDDSERAAALSESLSLEYILDLALSEVRSAVGAALKPCLSLIFVILFSKFASLSATLSEAGALSAAFERCALLVCSLAVVRAALSALRVGVYAISNTSTVVTALLPITEAVMLSSASVTQASVNNGALMVYVTLTENFVSAILVPLACALFALSFTYVGLDGVNITSGIRALRQLLLYLLGIFTVVFSFVLGIQSSLAKSADSLALKSVKFAVGSSVPLVGGAISEALGTVTSSLSLIRHTVGGIGILIILVTVLPPIIVLGATRVMLLACKCVSEVFECQKISELISDTDGVLSLFLAFSALSGVFFIFALTLFMNSGVT